MSETNQPIREAIVTPAASDLTTTVARVPVLLRTVLVLQRAGIERVSIVGADPPTDARVRCAVRRIPDLAPVPDDEPRIVIGPGTILDATLVGDLQRRARRDAVIELAADGARVRVAPGRLLQASATTTSPAAVGTLAPATTPPGRLVQQLLRGLENHRDGYLDKLIHRHFSRPTTRALLHTPLTPNGVTVLGILIGAAGGLVLGLPGFAAALAGTLLLVFSGVLDCSDGEMARLTFAESKIGHVLDVTGDTLVHLALFAGIATRLSASGATPDGTTLWLLLTGVLGSFAVITWSEVTETRRLRVDCVEDAILANVLSPLTTRDWYVFPMLFALAGRLDALVSAAAVGAHAFWIVTLVVLLRVLRRLPAA